MTAIQTDNVTLDHLREELSQEQSGNPYERFSLLSNPFPAAGQFIPGICVDQEEIKSEFARMLREFYRDTNIRIMSITGRTGAGKTNLLRFLEHQLRSWREPSLQRRSITDLYTVFIQEPGDNYFEIHRQIVSQIGAFFYTDFFNAVQHSHVNISQLPVELPGINPELVRVLEQNKPRKSGQLDFWGTEPQSLRILDTWLQGVKLSTTEKKQLGGISIDVGKSSSIAIKFLSDLVKIFQHAQLFKGIIFFFDEFEEIFSGLSPSIQARYAQDLRNLFQSLSEGCMFVIATTPISERLEQISPALNRRLGQGTFIQPIQSAEQALEYAGGYIQLGRDAFYKQIQATNRQEQFSIPENIPTEDHPYYPLSRFRIIEAYEKLREKIDVVPGDLLPVLNRELYQIVYEV